MKKLENRKLIYRQKENDNAKTVHIYVTENGERLSTAHKSFDNSDILKMQHELLKSCTVEEVDAFYKVMHEYIKLF